MADFVPSCLRGIAVPCLLVGQDSRRDAMTEPLGATRKAITDRIAALVAQKPSHIAEIYTAVERGDWQTVQDAASTLREIDAQLVLIADLAGVPV